MSKWSTRQIATAAIIAALYTVMSLLSSVFGLTYGPIQCRFSEALTVLPFFLPEAVPGLFVGCLVTNLMSTVGPLDIIFGSMATLLAALWTAKMPNKFLATLPPVICNAVIIGAMIAWYEGGFSAQFPALFAYNALTVESWMLDFDGDLYGQSIRVEFYKRLRDEIRFDSLDALKAEIQRNADDARTYFANKA